MFPRSSLLAALSCIAVFAFACSSTLQDFNCELDSDCQAEGQSNGICEANKFCSFTDFACGPNGRSYSENSGEFSNECVGARQPDAGVNDAQPGPDATPLCTLWQPANFQACALADPLGALDLSHAGVYTYDTDDGELRDPEGQKVPHTNQSIDLTPQVRAISVNDFTLGANTSLQVSGTRPLLIASFGEIDIQGVIDVGAEVGDSGVPAGQNPFACEGVGSSGNGGNGEGAGGGGGGGFAGAGGTGGEGNADGLSQRPGGAGGLAVPSTPMTPRGGCDGALGGAGGSRGGAAVVGGGGGGALQLSAMVRIRIQGDGRLDGRGAGGTGGESGEAGGGGGGGSGGWLGLDAPIIVLSDAAVVAANGGGGGGGGGRAIGAPGSNGEDGNLSAASASGGNGASTAQSIASAGGAGGAGATLAGTTVTATPGDGAGGGGGAAGFVVVWGDLSITEGAVVSPIPTAIVP